MAERTRIIDPSAVEEWLSAGVSAHWAGGVAHVRRVSEALGTDALQINAVYFEAGVRSRPHKHSFDQILLYTSGPGIIAVDGGDDQRVEAGDFVLLPAGVPHMHGASTDGPACHISLMRDVDMDFDCPIPESWAKWRS